MSVHLKLTIKPYEYSALLKLALSEMRTPESQLYFLLRKELVSLKLLNTEEVNDSSVQFSTSAERGRSHEI